MEYTLIDYIKNIQKDAIVSMIVDNISCVNTDKVQNGFIVAIANTPTGIKKTMLEELVYNKIKDNKASAFSSGLAVGAVSTKLQDYILEVSVYLLAGGYESDPLSAESEAFHDQCGVVANYFGVDEDMEDEVHDFLHDNYSEENIQNVFDKINSMKDDKEQRYMLFMLGVAAGLDIGDQLYDSIEVPENESK